MAVQSKGTTSIMAFTLWLGLTLVVILMVVYILIPLLKSDQSKSSFLQLHGKINQFSKQPSGDAGYYLLELSHGGGVVFFDDESDGLVLTYSVPIMKEIPFHGDEDIYFLRPQICEKGAYCMCYVKRFALQNLPSNTAVAAPAVVPQSWLVKPSLPEFGLTLYGKMEENGLLCKSFSGQLYFAFDDCTNQIPRECFKAVDGKRIDYGMIFWNHIYFHKDLKLVAFIIPGGFKNIYLSELRQRPIFIEKYKEVVAFGLADPVLSPADKKIIDVKYDLKKGLQSCVENQFCVDPTITVRAVLADEGEEKLKWHISFNKKSVPNTVQPETAADQFEMLFENQDRNPPIAESNDIAVAQIFIVPATVQGQSITPDYTQQEEVAAFEFKYEKSTDDFITIGIPGRKDERLVTIGNSFTYIYGPFTEEELAKKPYPLYLYYLKAT